MSALDVLGAKISTTISSQSGTCMHAFWTDATTVEIIIKLLRTKRH